MKKEPCKLELDKALKEIQTISRKIYEWKRRYEEQCFWTFLSAIVNIALTLALIGKYL